MRRRRYRHVTGGRAGRGHQRPHTEPQLRQSTLAAGAVPAVRTRGVRRRSRHEQPPSPASMRAVAVDEQPVGDARHRTAARQNKIWAVARWMATSTSVSRATRFRALSATPRRQRWRARKNSPTYAAPTPGPTPFIWIRDSGCDAGRGLGERPAPRQSHAETASPAPCRQWDQLSGDDHRHAMSAQSSNAPGTADPRRSDSRTMTPAHSTIVQRYAPANATRVQPVRRRSVKAAAELSERRFGVIVLMDGRNRE